MTDNHENVSVTDSVVDSQMSITESQIMSEVVHSTPVTNRKAEENDMMKYLCSMVCSMKESSDKQQAMLELKFNEIKSDSDAKFNIQNDKFEELKYEIKEIKKHLESTNETVRTSLNKLEQSVEKLGDNVLSITNINNDEIMKDVVSNSENDDVNYNSEV